jgi:hypothetical protein
MSEHEQADVDVGRRTGGVLPHERTCNATYTTSNIKHFR